MYCFQIHCILLQTITLTSTSCRLFNAEQQRLTTESPSPKLGSVDGFFSFKFRGRSDKVNTLRQSEYSSLVLNYTLDI